MQLQRLPNTQAPSSCIEMLAASLSLAIGAAATSRPAIICIFFGFNTFVADVRLCGGCFYLELQVVEIVGEPHAGV